MLTLGSIAEAIVDCEHRTAPDGGGYALLVGTRAMKNGRIVVDACKPISEETFENWTRRMRPQEGDLILAREAPVGQVVRVPNGTRYCLGQRTVLIRPKASVVEPRFLHYWLLGPGAQHAMTSVAAGATVPHLNVSDIRGLDVSDLPRDRGFQHFAAETLGSIDDLIENSRRRVEVLDAMARAIYREWFVRFRYPGHEDVPLVDSPLGPIPDGWEVRSLFDVADVGFGFSFKSKQFSETGPFPVIRIRDVPSGATKTYSNETPPERYRVIDGDILIGMDGEFHLRQWTGGEAWLNQRVARVRPIHGLSARHLMLAITGPIRDWNAAISGTTVAHLGKRHLEQVRILIPTHSVLDLATPLLRDLADEARILVQASRRLASLRDTLLPRLVTGRIDVAHLDLDALTEAAIA